MVYTNLGQAIEEEMQQQNPDIGNFPAYREDSVTMAQHKQLNYILSLLVQNRRCYIDELQQQMLAKATEVFGKIREDMENLNRYNIGINTAEVEKQQGFLKGNKTLSQLASRRYRFEDSQCKSILLQEPGDSKRQDFREFENDVFSRGIAAFFEQISTACEVLFAFIDEAVKAAHKEYAAEMPDSAEMVSDLIDELVAKCKASAHQIIETEKAQLQRKAGNGEYTEFVENLT